MNDTQIKAAQYLLALGESYAKTFPGPVAGPIMREIQMAAEILLPPHAPPEPPAGT